MGNFKYDLRNGIAWVTFDSGSMNTLSLAAIHDIATLRAELAAAHAKSPLAGVIVKGNRFGLGAGANIGELMNADRKGLEALIDKGHEELFGIEDSPFPWLAVIDGYALGGIYEFALAHRGIIAT
jgi:enoyl-CoA hydratase/carnithine racemase